MLRRSVSYLDLTPASVIPTGAPREFFRFNKLWRGVEGSRRRVLRQTASRRSRQTAVAPGRLSKNNVVTREARFACLPSVGVFRGAMTRGIIHGKNSLRQHGQGRT